MKVVYSLTPIYDWLDGHINNLLAEIQHYYDDFDYQGESSFPEVSAELIAYQKARVALDEYFDREGVFFTK